MLSDMLLSTCYGKPNRKSSLHRFCGAVEQVLLTFPAHLCSPPLFSGVRVIRSLLLCVMPCRSLFVLDTSKSMMGEPILELQRSMVNILDRLGQQDRFNIIVFQSKNINSEDHAQFDLYTYFKSCCFNMQ
jgi:hypothetical protein